MSTSVNDPGFPTAPAPRPGGGDPKAPGLAVLFLLPGLGQVYNGQPAKAFVFFFAWVGSIYGAAEINPFPFAFLIPFTFFYNLVDAYRSATLINLRAAGGAAGLEESTDESPAWGWSLVALGAVFLANNLGWLRLAAFARYWPLLLVVAGGLFVYTSIQKKKTGEADGGPRF